MAGIPVAPSMHLYRGDTYPLEEILDTLRFPVFVKPNNGGSSIGMSKVTEFSRLEAAIEKAVQEDDQVLVEQMVVGREFTVGVFKADNQITVLPFTEIKCEKEFFDFDAKYDGSTLEITPADTDENTRRVVMETAERIYRIFNCRGVVRIDFIYQEQEQKAYMLEVNTIPGQSATSIIPQQVQVLGWDLKVFYSKLVEACLA
jgi:D-alanine-D-alanine ligase